MTRTPEARRKSHIHHVVDQPTILSAQAPPAIPRQRRRLEAPRLNHLEGSTPGGTTKTC